RIICFVLCFVECDVLVLKKVRREFSQSIFLYCSLAMSLRFIPLQGRRIAKDPETIPPFRFVACTQKAILDPVGQGRFLLLFLWVSCIFLCQKGKIQHLSLRLQ